MPTDRRKEPVRIRQARRDVVDAIRTIYWYYSLCGRIGKWTVYMLEKTFEQIPYTKKKGKWRYFRDGRRTPRAPLVTKADGHLLGKGSAREINHVLWETLRPSFRLGRDANRWLQQLSPDVQNIVFVTEFHPANRSYYERREIDGRHLRALERQANLDSLACLTLLFREAHEKSDHTLMRVITESIYRTLLIAAQDFPMSKVANDVFKLYRELLFSLLPEGTLVSGIDNARFADDVSALAYQFSCATEISSSPADSWPRYAGLLHDIIKGKYHRDRERDLWELPAHWLGSSGLRPITKM